MRRQAAAFGRGPALAGSPRPKAQADFWPRAPRPAPRFRPQAGQTSAAPKTGFAPPAKYHNPINPFPLEEIRAKDGNLSIPLYVAPAGNGGSGANPVSTGNPDLVAALNNWLKNIKTSKKLCNHW